MASKLKAASLSIGVNVGLLLSKIIVAILTKSIGMIAECAHSLFDLVASFLAYLGIRKAQQPEDDSHPFGHEKFESLSSFLQSILILLTSGFIIYEAVHRLQNPVAVENTGIGIILMVISIPVALFTSWYLSKIAKKSGGSHALEADSAHFTTDVLSSVAVLVGLVFVRFGFHLGDIIAAFIVSLVMIYISIKLIRDAFYVFMDYKPDDVIMSKVRRILHSHKDFTYHKLKGRRAGSKVFVDVHIQVDRNLSVVASHQIAMDVKRELMRKVRQLKDVTIHVEPKYTKEELKRLK